MPKNRTEIVKTIAQLNIEQITVQEQLRVAYAEKERLEKQRAQFEDLTKQIKEKEADFKAVLDAVLYQENELDKLKKETALLREKSQNEQSQHKEAMKKLQSDINIAAKSLPSLKLQAEEHEKKFLSLVDEVCLREIQIAQLVEVTGKLHDTELATQKNVDSLNGEIAKLLAGKERLMGELAELDRQKAVAQKALTQAQDDNKTLALEFEQEKKERVKALDKERKALEGLSEDSKKIHAALDIREEALRLREEDLNLRDQWIEKKINTTKRYKKELELATGRRLDSLTF